MGTITLAEVKTRILKALNEYSINGEAVGATDENRMDYDLRMNSLVDMHQRRIATSSKKISSSYVFSQYPVSNEISDPLDQFDLVQFTGTTLYYSGGTDVKSYYFEVDGDCTVTIQQSADGETWDGTVTTISPAPSRYGLMTAYKGNITPTTDYYVRFAFSGTYAYNIRNIAFYAVSFPTDSDVPPYKDYRPYAMPSDFYQLRYIVLNGQRADSKKYFKTGEWKQEGRNYIYVPWFEKGEFRVYYWAYPTVIDDDTTSTDTLDIDDEAIDCIVYGVAMDLMDDEREPAYRRLKTKYNEFVARLDNSASWGGTVVYNGLFASASTNTTVF